MKLVFERETFEEILRDIESVLANAAFEAQRRVQSELAPTPENQAVPKGNEASSAETFEDLTGEGPGPEGPRESAPEAPAEKKPNSDTPDKKISGKASKAKSKKTEAPAPVDPAALVGIRQQTIEDLQAAYSDGKQKQVFDLLEKHGNGAKSFRELAPEAFLPIRKAIDAGALK